MTGSRNPGQRPMKDLLTQISFFQRVVKTAGPNSRGLLTMTDSRNSAQRPVKELLTPISFLRRVVNVFLPIDIDILQDDGSQH